MVYYFRQRLPILLTVAFLFLLGVAFGSIAVRTLSQAQASDLRAYLDQFCQFSSRIGNHKRQAVAWRGVVDNIIKISGLVWFGYDYNRFPNFRHCFVRGLYWVYGRFHYLRDEA